MFLNILNISRFPTVSHAHTELIIKSSVFKLLFQSIRSMRSPPRINNIKKKKMVSTEVQMNDWVNMLMYIINGASFIGKKKVKQVYRFSLN